MEHLLLKAATTATDEGTFTAVISTASVDRDKDIIEPAAMVASLAKWAALGKRVPLAWNHTDEVIGHIDPGTAVVKNGEVITDGWVDQKIPRGEEAWRLVKSGTLSFSFGFLFEPKTGATKLPNGRHRVKELDIFEISAIPVGPANNDTRVLSFKSAEEQERLLALSKKGPEILEAVKAVVDVNGALGGKVGLGARNDLRKESDRRARELLDATLPEVNAEDSDRGPSLEAVQEELAAVKAALVEAEQKLATPKDPEELRKDSERLEREVAESKIPKIPSSDLGPRVDLEKQLQEVKAQLVETTTSLEDLKRKGEQDPERLRKESDRRAREVAEVKLPDDIPVRPVAPEPDVVKELHEVKAQLAEMAAGYEIMKKKAEEADKEPETVRSVDPLRKRSEELALEVSSGGMSLRKPPTEVKEQPSEPVDVEALRRKSRDHMFEVLSYSTE